MIFNQSVQSVVGQGTRRLQIILASWNARGFRLPANYDQIIAFMMKRTIAIIMIQETWQVTSSHFQNTVSTEPHTYFSIFQSAECKYHHACVGFFFSQKLRPFKINFTSQSPRVASIRVRTQPRPVPSSTFYVSRLSFRPSEKKHSGNKLQQTNSGRHHCSFCRGLQC
jgi:hypothetical protein